jgi:acetyl-CoA carboxylase biotin carboxyl carrier protein
MAEQPTWQDLLDLVAQLNESNFESASVSYGNISVQLSNSDAFMGQAVASAAAPAAVAPAPATHAAPGAATAAPAAPAPAAAPAKPAGETIDAPMIGTFYRRPAPGTPEFVQPGDRVEADTTIGIIEIMKLMNPIAAGKAGVIGEFLVSDAEPVEFGTPLATINTNA